ncbi:MAG: hypothetical protein LBK50_01730 [Candidatus Nomurabacteria bacterium]|jgi:hypothetical protein|nr:hypothetical protein [Candidatus Nomurabacteria bacterium]
MSKNNSHRNQKTITNRAIKAEYGSKEAEFLGHCLEYLPKRVIVEYIDSSQPLGVVKELCDKYSHLPYDVLDKVVSFHHGRTNAHEACLQDLSYIARYMSEGVPVGLVRTLPHKHSLNLNVLRVFKNCLDMGVPPKMLRAVSEYSPYFVVHVMTLWENFRSEIEELVEKKDYDMLGELSAQNAR